MKKVSMVVPCYNVSRFLNDFFQTVLDQKYSSLELIMVNDGSVDETQDIIFQWKERVEACGIDLVYVYKENGGLASAVEAGVKRVTGEYLIWSDPDDFLLPNSIQKRVEYLDKHPDCGIVRANGYVYNEADKSNPISAVSKLSRTTTLEDFVKFIVPWCAGCYMIRMSAFDKANPKRYLFKSKSGQNIQMLLPVVYYYDCHYLDEYVYGYVIYNDSMSRKIDTFEKQDEYKNIVSECVRETLRVIPEDTNRYLMLNEKFIRFQKYYNAWEYGKKEKMKEYELDLKKHKETDLKTFVMKHFRFSGTSKFLVRVVDKIKRTFKLE